VLARDGADGAFGGPDFSVPVLPLAVPIDSGAAFDQERLAVECGGAAAEDTR
jgi:hypothetical protein